FRTPAARSAADYWRRVEANRKRPWRAARLIGWRFLVHYMARRLTLEQAAAHIGQRIGIRIKPLELDHAEASVDVDSVSDWTVIRQQFGE
ncbi:MAG: hypothetical protein KDB18_14105, partial [Salinibacterium sp.]|nr:hypothetical protein [Salinibacterium sp.]